MLLTPMQKTLSGNTAHGEQEEVTVNVFQLTQVCRVIKGRQLDSPSVFLAGSNTTQAQIDYKQKLQTSSWLHMKEATRRATDHNSICIMHIHVSCLDHSEDTGPI